MLVHIICRAAKEKTDTLCIGKLYVCTARVSSHAYYFFLLYLLYFYVL